jgi:transposase
MKRRDPSGKIRVSKIEFVSYLYRKLAKRYITIHNKQKRKDVKKLQRTKKESENVKKRKYRGMSKQATCM